MVARLRSSPCKERKGGGEREIGELDGSDFWSNVQAGYVCRFLIYDDRARRIRIYSRYNMLLLGRTGSGFDKLL